MIEPIGDRPVRSFTEIIIKTLAICITTNIAAGHLNTLRCISRKDRAEAIFSVVFFLILPGLPLATLIYDIYYALRARNGGLSFRFAVMLGMRATPIRDEEGEVSIPLSEIPYRNVQRVSKNYDLEWVARMFVLLAFETQAIATIILVARRIGHKDQQTYDRAAAPWDLFGGAVAFGGATAGLISIGILLLNHKWECFSIEPNTREGTTQVQRHFWPLVIPDSMVYQMTLAVSIDWLSFLISEYSQIKNEYLKSGWYLVLGECLMLLAFAYPFPCLRFLEKAKIMAGCSVAIIELIILVYLYVQSMKSSTSNGWWKEVMWVDPLAEKLYVF